MKITMGTILADIIVPYREAALDIEGVKSAGARADKHLVARDPGRAIESSAGFKLPEQFSGYLPGSNSAVFRWIRQQMPGKQK